MRCQARPALGAGWARCALAAAVVAGCGGTSSGRAGTADATGGADVYDAAGQVELPAPVEGACAGATTATEFLPRIDCVDDFQALASEPIDATLPGARSVKVVLDQKGGDALYFQNSVLYPVHFLFASTHLSGSGLPVIGQLSDFNATEYYSPDRRFVLGAVTYYEGPGRWVLEMAPYDTASAAMIAKLFEAVQAHAFFGPSMYFHPTSEAVGRNAKGLPATVPQITTGQLFGEIDYEPLVLASGIGRLRFLESSRLDTTYVSYEDILVLDQAPNDITVVRGLITQEFQTPLSHVNVLSANRHTPNMGLRGAMTNPALRALEGRTVRLTVGALAWTVAEVSEAEAQAYWASARPEPVTLPAMDLDEDRLLDIEAVTPDPTGDETLRGNIEKAVYAFGGKAAHYSILARTEGVPVRKAFAVPVRYYWLFMKDNGFFDRVDALLADPSFVADPDVRDARLLELRSDMLLAPLDAGLEAALKAKLAADYPGRTLRFRTSTNSEDLDGFPCAGCYESQTGDPADWADVQYAIRKTYASTWLFRTFEERTYYGVDHASVGMALLVHPNFPDEEANGVAVTANPFDATGVDPAFYVNVQKGGEVEVVHPIPGIGSDEFLYFFSQPNQPIAYLSHSSLVPDGATVLTARQVHDLGVALAAIHERFSAAYGPAAGNDGWYAMDVEFKFSDGLAVKQARPYPGRGQ